MLNTCEAVTDSDEDGILDDIDNCPMTFNPDQADNDMDMIGDACDDDDDNDGIPDTCDIDSNPGAVDFDRDGIVDGSECDTEIRPPVDKDQCKKGGFLRFNNPTFRNQGQCVSYVNGRRP